MTFNYKTRIVETNGLYGDTRYSIQYRRKYWPFWHEYDYWYEQRHVDCTYKRMVHWLEARSAKKIAKVTKEETHWTKESN